MKNIETIDNLQTFIANIKKQNKTIGFVPTMGALHEGHISLIKKARKENDIVIVSIFVNPTQFLAHEDLDSYPSKITADTKICELCDVDILFTPDINMMYSEDELTIKAPTLKSYYLEGFNRPEHFDGVLQVVLKLFNLTQPNNAYFGRKDAQQLILIQQMTNNLFLNVKIIECDTIRESNGLAMSSRNIYLSAQEKELALLITKSLRVASKLIINNVLDSNEILSSMNNTLTNELIQIEYIEIVNRTFQKITTVEIDNTIIVVAIKIGTTRLIDNLWL